MATLTSLSWWGQLVMDVAIGTGNVFPCQEEKASYPFVVIFGDVGSIIGDGNGRGRSGTPALF